MDWNTYPCKTAGCGHLAPDHSVVSEGGKVPCTLCGCDAYRNDAYAAVAAKIEGARLPEPE